MRLHDLRHSFASFGAAAGLSLPMIGRMLGHSQAATTARYVHLADDPVRAAMERVTTDIANFMSRNQDDDGEEKVVKLPKGKP